MIQAETKSTGLSHKKLRSSWHQLNVKSPWQPPDTSAMQSSISSLTNQSGRWRRKLRRRLWDNTEWSSEQMRGRNTQHGRKRSSKPVQRERGRRRSEHSTRTTASRRSYNDRDLSQVLQQISRDVNLLKSRINL